MIPQKKHTILWCLVSVTEYEGTVRAVTWDITVKEKTAN